MPKLEYRGKMILAPMVKVGTLPMRLLALEYGADIVYTEEIIDMRLLASERVENKILGTVDYIDRRDNCLVFRTCAKEKDKLVLQIGTNDGDRAAAVAKKVEGDISGLDVNMGCPKGFSLKGGMGAALLTQPQKVRDILTKLVAAVNIPVTAKIRLLPSLSATLELVSLIESCGVAALGVHGRTKEQRPNDVCDVESIKAVVRHANLPIIANGGSSNNRNSQINTYVGIRNFWEETRAASVMVARAAEWNPSVFREGEKEDIMMVIEKYFGYAIEYDYPFNIVKYCVQQLLGSLQESELGRNFLNCATMGDLCEVFGLAQLYKEKQQLLASQERPDKEFSEKMDKEEKLGKRKRKIGEDTVTEMFCPFVRGHYGVNESSDLPKTLLLLYARQKQLGQPKYVLEQQDKQFRARVRVGEHSYGSMAWEKNKKYAEQGAALVAVKCLNITKDDIVWKQSKVVEETSGVEETRDTLVSSS